MSIPGFSSSLALLDSPWAPVRISATEQGRVDGKHVRENFLETSEVPAAAELFHTCSVARPPIPRAPINGGFHEWGYPNSWMV